MNLKVAVAVVVVAVVVVVVVVAVAVVVVVVVVAPGVSPIEFCSKLQGSADHLINCCWLIIISRC